MIDSAIEVSGDDTNQSASHVQILRRQPSISPTRHSGRKYRPLATSLRVASGWRPS